MLQLMPIQQRQSTEDNIVSTECNLMSLLIGIIRMQKIWVLTCESWHEVWVLSFPSGLWGLRESVVEQGISYSESFRWLAFGVASHHTKLCTSCFSVPRTNQFTWKRGSDCAVELNWQHCMWDSVLKKLKNWQIAEFGINSQREVTYFGNIQIPL